MFILTFFLVVLGYLVHAGGYEGDGRNRTSYIHISSTTAPSGTPNQKGLATYPAIHLDDAAWPPVSASGWLAIPPAFATWMVEYRGSQSEVSRADTNTVPRILGCAKSLVHLYSTDAHIKDANATYMALMECKQAIDRGLSGLAGQDYPTLVSRSYHHRKTDVVRGNTVMTDEKDWIDQVQGCVDTFCTGIDRKKGNCDLEDFLGGLGGPWQDCHLCHPRNNKERTEFPQIIGQHCKKMVTRQWHAFMALCALITTSLLAAFVAILIKNRRAAKEKSKKAWIEARMKARTATRGCSWPTAGRSRVQSAPNVEVPNARKSPTGGLRRRLYQLFGRKAAYSHQDDRLEMSRLSREGQGRPSSARLVLVMHPAPNAKGRSSSFDAQGGPSTGTRAKQGLDNTADAQRQHAHSDPGPNKHASFSESMPVTNQVFEYGLKGRLCTSEESQEV